MSRRSARLLKEEPGESAPSLPRASSSSSNAKAGTKKRTSNQVDVDVTAKGGLEPSTQGDAKPLAKRRKVASGDTKIFKPSAKRRQRGLKMIAEMPVDILLEIFQHLDPADLLSLSRTDRTLRAYVMKRSVALPWWDAAFKRVEPKPPACPEGMSLPQYANLLYGRTCFFCSTTQGLTRSWSAYIRACKKCLSNDNLFITFTKGSPPSSIEYELRQMTGPISSKYGDPVVLLREDFEKHRGVLTRLDSQDKAESNTYFRKSAEEINRRLSRARNEFKDWDAREARQKEEELKARRADRKSAILGKLEELGYSEAIKRLGDKMFTNIHGINAVTLLTDKEWERVKPGILAVLDEDQRVIDSANRRQFISKRTALLEGLLQASISQNRELNLPKVPASQLAKLEPFRTIIYDTPKSKQLEVKHLMKHFDKIPSVLQTWKTEAEETLLSLIQASELATDKGKKGKGKRLALGLETLDLATTIFWCKWCGKSYPTTYPSVLTHTCLFERHAADRASSYAPSRNPRIRQLDRQIQYLNDEDRADPNPGWNQGGNQLFFLEEASKYAAAIVAALGKDPKVATWEDLDRANERLECVNCRLPQGGKERLKGFAMDWRQAVLHQLDDYSIHLKFQFVKGKRGILTYKNSWKKLNAQSTAKAYKKELNDESKDATPLTRYSPEVYCTECSWIHVKKDGTVFRYKKKDGYSSSTLVKPGAKKCSEGHDLKKKGTFTNRYGQSGWYDCSFRVEPKPVRIP